MTSPVSLIIHFVGIVLFSSQVPNDCGLKAILPLIVHANPGTEVAGNTSMAVALKPMPAPSPSSKVATAPVVGVSIGPAHYVEDHIALLVFRADSFVTSTNWGTPATLPGDNPNNYEYVKLDGDHVRFDSGMQNSAASIANLKLPPLETLCPSTTSLNASFQPPYSGAAAVFDLPQGNVNACMPGGPRIDTEVTLDSSGELIVSASTMRTKKEIRLRPAGDTFELIVANVPASCLTGHCSAPNQTDLDDISHVHAYFGMGNGKANGNNNKSIAWWVEANSPPPNSQLPPNSPLPSNQCVVHDIPPAAGGFGMAGIMPNTGSNPATPGNIAAIAHVNVPEPAKMTDFECSNSKWP